MTETPTKYQKFLRLYEARFADFPAKKRSEAEPWGDMLKTVPEGKIDEMVREVERLLGDRRGKPRLPLFEKAIKKLHLDETKQRGITSEFCEFCGQTGMMDYPASVENIEEGGNVIGRKTVLPHLTERSEVSLLWFTTPCSCNQAKRADVTKQNEVFDWLRAVDGLVRMNPVREDGYRNSREAYMNDMFHESGEKEVTA